MNKKFSTLVAVLLAAGAWTTMDATVVNVPSPKVGGTYLLGTNVTAADDGGLTGLVTGVSGIKADDETAVVAFGNEWILEAAETKGQFYLKQKSTGKYLAGTASANTTLLVDDKATQNVLIFTLNGKTFVVADVVQGVGNATIIAAGNLLQLSGTGATETLNCGTSDNTKDIDAVATYEVGTAITMANFNQDVNAVSKYNTDDYYFIAQEGGYYLNAENATTVAPKASLGSLATGAVDEALWKVVELEATNGVYQYKFVNKKYPELSAYLGANTNTVFSSANPYNKGFNLTCGASDVAANFATSGAPVAVGLYSAPNSVVSANELNKLLNNGFNLSFKADKDGKITVDYTSAFDGKLVAVASGDAYQIKSGDDFVVLEAGTSLTSGIAGAKGKFVKVSQKELTANADKYMSYFQITRNAGKATSAVGTLTVAKANTMADARYAYIPVAEGVNGKTAVLTTIAADNFKIEEAPIITLSASDMVDFKDLLGQFMSITFVSDEAEAKDAPKDMIYKKNGILSTIQYAGETEAKADYVDLSTVLSNAPEVQWAISSVDEATGLFTLTNRESGKKLEGVSFRKTDKAGEWIVETVKDESGNSGIIGDVVKVKLFDNKNITMFDGFQTYTPNELRNMVFNIGQYHNETGNTAGYWAENHQSNASHQLGVVADENKATNWALRLDQRKYAEGTNAGEEIANVVDTIFIETPMATYQKGKLVQGAAGDKDVVVSRLAVLPYQIQNKGNFEYVKFEDGTNLKYYVCDEKPNREENADRFALKMKPNGFNIVTLSGNGTDKVLVKELGTDKIYAGNSDEWGNLKNQDSYKPDDNSIMVVKPIDRPEYRKVVAEWGDTVRIYRQEYPTEVLFEKRDDKSVVDKDTLSFLNVNNSITGANPAIFVDTAYVNRVDADGVKNTCYQYLLAVDVNNADEAICPYNPLHNSQEWRDKFNGGKPCADATDNKAVRGRFLINLVDTAFAYKQSHLHNNPYVNMVEAGQDYKAKLSFVEGVHANDTLYITRKGGEVVKLAMDTAAFNVAKFAFRYVNNEEGSFKIQTQYKEYAATTKDAFEKSANNEGYLRWINGTIVVTNDYLNGETFNMEEGFAGDPTANENAPKVSSISVEGGNGYVTIKGAAGKTVSISNVLGQTTSTKVTSDNATIAAPAGIVVVAVEGEAAVKAIVK